jgi:Zn-finger nucleic acid-binding protein
MELRARHGVEIDLCPGCRGVWLDRSELDAIIERSGRFLEIPGEDESRQTRTGYRREDLRGDRFEWF